MGFLGAMMSKKLMGKLGGKGGGGKGAGPMPLPAIYEEARQEGGKPAQYLGSLQEGTDYVPETGMAKLHKGEAVIPAPANAVRQAIAQMLSGGQMRPPQMPQGQPRIPQMPPPQQGGGGGIVLPSGQASRGVPGVPMSAGGQGVTERFRQMPGAAFRIQQEMHQRNVEKYRQLANRWIAMASQGDPMKVLAQQGQASPEMGKAVEKLKKEFTKMIKDAMEPNSAASQGVQMAYQDQEKQQQQRMATQQLMAEIQRQQAMAQYYSQRPEETAFKEEELDKRQQVAEQGKFQRFQMQTQARWQQQQTQIQAALTKLKSQQDFLKQITQMKEASATGRARMRTQQANAANVLLKQCQDYDSELGRLVAERNNLQKEIAEHPLSGLIGGESDEMQLQMQTVDQQIAGVMQQIQGINTQIGAMTAGGILPSTPAPQGGGGNRPKVVEMNP